MTAIAPPAPAPPEIDLTKGNRSKKRVVRDRLATIGMVVAFLFALVPLGFVMVSVIAKGLSMISTSWFTENIPDVASFALADKADVFGVSPSDVAAAAPVYGMQPAIVGTILTTALAAVLAIPLGILGAIYLNEYGKQNRFARTLRFFTDVMTGVPSVIMGIFIYTIWVVPRGVDGRAAVAGGLALACLMLPIVVRSTEEMLKLVPDSLREASAALGTRTWKTTTGVTIPAALGGIVSGCMLAVARAAGETAPIILVVGSTRFTNWSLSGVNTTLSAQIFANATQPGGESLAWGAALTLIAIVLLMTVLARLVASRYAIRSAGG